MSCRDYWLVLNFFLQVVTNGSCLQNVLKASAVKCRLIPWINPWLTLDHHLDRHGQHLDQYSVDTRLALDRHFNWHSIDSQSIDGGVLTKSYASIDTMMCLWKSVNSPPTVNWDVDQVLTEYLVDQVIKYNNASNWKACKCANQFRLLADE